jgi:flagellar biosynthesis protein FliP
MLATFGAFAITIGLLFLTLHLLKRVHGQGPSGSRVPLTVIQRISTGPRQGIGLVRVADRVLVVSLSERGATLLTELAGAALEQVIGADGAASAPSSAPTAAIDGGESAFARALRAARGTLVPRGLRVGGLIMLLAFASHSAIAQAPAAQGTQNAAPAAGTAVPRPAVPAPPIARPKPIAPAPAAGNGVPTPQTTAVVPLRATAPRPAHDASAPHAPPIQPPTVNAPGTPKIEFDVSQGGNQLKLSGTVGLVVFLGALTLLPALFLLMTSFTRILIVLSFLKSALGTQTAPPGQLLVALAVMLTGVIMHPILDRVSHEALTPYFDNQITQVEAYTRAVAPFRDFMLANLRPRDLDSFADMSGITSVKSVDDVPTVTIVAAFVTSELRTAFQMGFAIYLPFIVVDLIVASVLMSMGMMMVPPVMVSLPFKLLLFVLADGWTLIVRNLVASFHL